MLERAFTWIERERVLSYLMFPSWFRPTEDLADPKDFALVMDFARLEVV